MSLSFLFSSLYMLSFGPSLTQSQVRLLLVALCQTKELSVSTV